MRSLWSTCLVAAALLVFVPPAAHAQDSDGLKLPPPGTTIMNLSATETEKVSQDMIVASLRLEVDEADAKAVQAKINQLMQMGLDRAKKEAKVKTWTGTYSVYSYDPNPVPPQPNEINKARPMRWRGTQTIEMQSLQTDTVLDVVTDLQKMGFIMNNLGYTLSPEKYESVQDGLLVKALGKLKAKADLATKTLGKSGYEMLNIDLGAGGYPQPMYGGMMMARAEMAMDSSMPKAAAAPGETDVSLSVSARVLLK
jgi:predicted secreted protein